jgi:hypothetical protein
LINPPEFVQGRLFIAFGWFVCSSTQQMKFSDHWDEKSGKNLGDGYSPATLGKNNRS